MEGLTGQGYKCVYRGKVSTVSTLLIINNLSVYKSPYIFSKVSTWLGVRDLSVYINVIEDILRINIHGEGQRGRAGQCT
jgi:hypothetical protein